MNVRPSRFRFIGFILFFLLIYIEITIFAAVADELGVLSTLLLTFLTSVLGVSLVKNEGIRNLINIQQKLAGNEDPSKEVIKSFALLISGLLLFIPGFFTDLLGLVLLVPFIQSLVIKKFLPHVKVAKSGPTFWGETNQSDSNTFDGEFTKKADYSEALENKDLEGNGSDTKRSENQNKEP